MFVTSHIFEKGKKKVCSTFLLVEMNYRVVSTTNSFSHTFLPACFPPHLGHKCLPAVTSKETQGSWDKFLLFHVLLLWFGLFIWICKDENSLQRACNPSNEKGGTQRKNIFGKREEEKIIMVQCQMSLYLMSSRAVLILGTLKEASGVRMSQEPQVPAWTSKMPRDVLEGLSLTSLPPIPSMASPAGDGEDACPSTGMVASGMCVLLV